MPLAWLQLRERIQGSGVVLPGAGHGVTPPVCKVGWGWALGGAVLVFLAVGAQHPCGASSSELPPFMHARFPCP